MFKSVAILLLATVVSACSSNTPSSGDISAAFKTTELPGLLKLESFEVESPRNIGSKDDPTWLARYTAEVATREDTFDIETVTDGKRLLKPVHSAGTGFKLYGIVRSERSGDGWRHHFQSDSSSNPVLGRPRSDYGPDALVIGSPEALALIAEARQRQQQEAIEREARLAEEAAERKRAEDAEAAARQRLEAAVAKYDAGFAPQQMADLRYDVDVGDEFTFLVKASMAGKNDVIGTTTYKIWSDFAKSVIHAGLLKPGETGVVSAKVVASDYSPFLGSPRNGVDSLNSSKSDYAYTLRLLERIDTGTELAP